MFEDTERFAPLVAGERVFLRHPRAEDEEEYTHQRRVSADFLRPWDPLPPEGVDAYGPEAFRAYLRRSIEKNRQSFVVCRADGGEILGGINVGEIVLGVFLSAYLGYWVSAPHAGRGYMTEALTLLVGHAFETMGLHRLEANIQPNNKPSLALVRRVGFRREGYSPRYLRIAGEWRDHERWAITAEEWPRTTATGD